MMIFHSKPIYLASLKLQLFVLYYLLISLNSPYIFWPILNFYLSKMLNTYTFLDSTSLYCCLMIFFQSYRFSFFDFCFGFSRLLQGVSSAFCPGSRAIMLPGGRNFMVLGITEKRYIYYLIHTSFFDNAQGHEIPPAGPLWLDCQRRTL